MGLGEFFVFQVEKWVETSELCFLMQPRREISDRGVMRVCQLAVANLPETGFQLAGRKCCLPAALMDLKGIAAN